MAEETPLHVLRVPPLGHDAERGPQAAGQGAAFAGPSLPATPPRSRSGDAGARPLKKDPQVPAPPSEASCSPKRAWAQGSRLRVRPWNVTPLSPSGCWCPEDPRPPWSGSAPFAFTCASRHLMPRPAGPGELGPVPQEPGYLRSPWGRRRPWRREKAPPTLPLTSGSWGLRLLIYRKEGVFWAPRRVSRLGVKGERVLEKVPLRAPQGGPSRVLGPGEEGPGLNPTSQAPWQGRGAEGAPSAAETDLRETQANGFISNISGVLGCRGEGKGVGPLPEPPGRPSGRLWRRRGTRSPACPRPALRSRLAACCGGRAPGGCVSASVPSLLPLASPSLAGRAASWPSRPPTPG